jgi:hypothetical protein
MAKVNKCRTCGTKESEFMHLNVEEFSEAPTSSSPIYLCDICIRAKGLPGQPFAAHLTNQLLARLAAIEALLFAIFNQVDDIPKEEHHLH